MRGHRRTYIGALPGRIIQVTLQQTPPLPPDETDHACTCMHTILGMPIISLLSALSAAPRAAALTKSSSVGDVPDLPPIAQECIFKGLVGVAGGAEGRGAGRVAAVGRGGQAGPRRTWRPRRCPSGGVLLASPVSYNQATFVDTIYETLCVRSYQRSRAPPPFSTTTVLTTHVF